MPHASPRSDTTLLYLIRHGATDANERRPYILQGCGIDLPLSDAGRRQAAAVAEFLRPFPIRAVFSSPLKRSIETAGAIAEPHGFDATPLQSLGECNVGRWEGKDWDSISCEHPEEYRAFMDDPWNTPYLGGESYADVLARTEPVLRRIMENYPGRSIVVVAHQVVNRAYLAHLLKLDLHHARGIRQSNTGINVIQFRDGEAELRTLNADFHLSSQR
ncbi:MAG: histidine phosphatase family protein [Planctomycetaceae bacterium]